MEFRAFWQLQRAQPSRWEGEGEVDMGVGCRRQVAMGGRLIEEEGCVRPSRRGWLSNRPKSAGEMGRICKGDARIQEGKKVNQLGDGRRRDGRDWGIMWATGKGSVRS